MGHLWKENGGERMWRTVGEIILLTAIGFVGGLITHSNLHKCPEPQSYSSYELRVYVPTTSAEVKKLILHNRAQFSILQQLEEWDAKDKPKKGK